MILIYYFRSGLRPEYSNKIVLYEISAVTFSSNESPLSNQWHQQTSLDECQNWRSFSAAAILVRGFLSRPMCSRVIRLKCAFCTPRRTAGRVWYHLTLFIVIFLSSFSTRHMIYLVVKNMQVWNHVINKIYGLKTLVKTKNQASLITGLKKSF
jgi:hypothetical protein